MGKNSRQSAGNVGKGAAQQTLISRFFTTKVDNPAQTSSSASLIKQPPATSLKRSRVDAPRPEAVLIDVDKEDELIIQPRSEHVLKPENVTIDKNSPDNDASRKVEEGQRLRKGFDTTLDGGHDTEDNADPKPRKSRRISRSETMTKLAAKDIDENRAHDIKQEPGLESSVRRSNSKVGMIHNATTPDTHRSKAEEAAQDFLPGDRNLALSIDNEEAAKERIYLESGAIAGSEKGVSKPKRSWLHSSHDETLNAVDAVSQEPLALRTYLYDPNSLATELLCRNEEQRQRFASRIRPMEISRFPKPEYGEQENDAEAQDPTSKSRIRSRPVLPQTPLEKQVLALKAKYAGVVLIIEVGYKFRFFGNDAEIASKVCHLFSFMDRNFLTCSFPTHRLGHYVNKIVMAGYKCGVVRQTETAALKKGKKLGSSASGPFERKLVGLYTKSTMMGDISREDPVKVQDPTKMEPSTQNFHESHYLVCLVQAKGACKLSVEEHEIGFLAVDVANGDCIYDQFHDSEQTGFQELDSRLEAIGVSEFLLPEESELSPGLSTFISQYSRLRSGVRVERFAQSEACHDGMLWEELREQLGSEFSLVPSCCSAASQYLTSYDLSRAVLCSTDYRCFMSSQQMKLDASSVCHFDLFSSQRKGGESSTLFSLINMCKTPFGSRQLLRWLQAPLIDQKAIQERQELVRILSSVLDENSTQKAPETASAMNQCIRTLVELMSKCPDLEKGIMRVYHEKCSPLEFVNLMESLKEFALVFSQRAEAGAKAGAKAKTKSHKSDQFDASTLLNKLISSGDAFSDMKESCQFMLGMLDLDIAKEKLKPKNMYAVFSKEALIILRKETSIPLEGLSRLVENLETIQDLKEELDQHHIALESIRKAIELRLRRLVEWKTVMQDEYLVEVPVSEATQVPASWTRIGQTKAMVRFRTKETSDILQKLNESRELLQDSGQRCWKSFLSVAASQYVHMRKLVRLLAYLDCLYSLYKVGKLDGYCRPHIESDDQIPAGIEIKGGRHPLVELLLNSAGKAFVPLDICIGLNARMENRGIVITGPNMGGKTTLLRTISMISIMAQIGCSVPAESCRISPFHSMYSRIGSADNILRGQSTFLCEMNEASNILSNANERSLVIIDELGRGTSTHDGTCIAYSALEYMLCSLKSCTLFVTHYPLIPKSLFGMYPELVRTMYMDYVKDEEQEAARTRIRFLYRPVEGIAEHSYGLNVAELAGIQPEILVEAEKEARALQQRVESHHGGLSRVLECKDKESLLALQSLL